MKVAAEIFKKANLAHARAEQAVTLLAKGYKSPIDAADLMATLGCVLEAQALILQRLEALEARIPVRRTA